MKALYFAGAALFGICLTGCPDPRSQNMDHLGINTDSTASGSGKGIAMNLLPTPEWTDSETDPTAEDEIQKAPYDGSAGFEIQQGTAGIVVMAAIFDDTVDSKGYVVLQGDLKITNPAADVVDVQLLPKENRRFVVTGNKLGHVDLHVEINGAPGAITVPIDVIPIVPTTTTP